MLKILAFRAGAIAAVTLMAVVAPNVVDHTKGKPRYQPHEVEAAKESIALSLLGQLQLSVGDLMWLKSMEYLHHGNVQRMPTRAEEELGYRRQDAQDAAIGLGHAEGVNMTLDVDRDWRGVFGDVERAVQPYRAAHGHDDPVELIPWYQLAVQLNPSLERLYTLGAFYMADFAKAPGDARQMLEAGIDANPYSFEVHAALGRLYVDYADRLDELVHSHGHGDGHSHGDHGHAHDHGDGHSHGDDDHAHDHADDHSHDEHSHDHSDDHSHDEHSHDHADDHSHGGHSHDHEDGDSHDAHSHDHEDGDSHDAHTHDHGDGHSHSHGHGHSHSHRPHKRSVPVTTPEQAHKKAERLLAKAVRLADDQRKQMAVNRQIFDDFQNQVFGESYLYLSKARLALGDYEGAVHAAEEGYDAVKQYTQRNLLRVQARVANKALAGEAAGDDDLARLARTRNFTDSESLTPDVGRSNSDWEEDPLPPVSVLAGIAPPAEIPTQMDEAALKNILEDVRQHPYQTLEERAKRIGRDTAQLSQHLEILADLHFVQVINTAGQDMHALTPPGLYVARGTYGFDFWSIMNEEALALHAQGIEVDLVADATAEN